jgi:diguanylate cyclase (GGDEF)-like protein
MKDTLTFEQALALIDNGLEPIALFDADDRLIAANAALRKLLGTAGETLIGQRLAEINSHPAHAVLAASGTFAYLSGDDRHGYFVAHDLRLPPGAPAVRARLLRDVSEQEHLRAECDRLQMELDAQALHDPITGLLNRRGLIVALEPQVSRCRRYSSPLSVITMDVYAANADASFLLRVSQILKDQLRWADVISCSENHEFILVLPETRRDDALALTEKLNDRLGSEFQGDTSAWMAYGVVECQKTDNTTILLQRAQSALEQAREAHNDRIAVAL